MADCPKDFRQRIFLVVVIVGLVLVHIVVVSGMTFSLRWLGASPYWQGCASGMLSIALPFWFLDYIFGGDDDAKPEQNGGQSHG